MNRHSDFERFLHIHEQRIYFQIHRLGISREWYEEFYGEGMLALWQAYRDYEKERGELGTFLNYRIRFRLLDLVRKKMREKKATEKTVQEKKLQLDNGNRHRKTGNPIIDIQEIEVKESAFWEELQKRLTKKQWKWVQYTFIAQLSVKEIMEIEGVSSFAVKAWGAEVRRKLRNDTALKERLESLQ